MGLEDETRLSRYIMKSSHSGQRRESLLKLLISWELRHLESNTSGILILIVVWRKKKYCECCPVTPMSWLEFLKLFRKKKLFLASVSIFGRQQCKLPVATQFFPISGSAPFHLPHSCQLANHNYSKYTAVLGLSRKNDFLKLPKPIRGRTSSMMTDGIRYSVTWEAAEWPAGRSHPRSGMKSDDYLRLVQNTHGIISDTYIFIFEIWWW